MTLASHYLIVGLGNPGRRFRGNRHNVGFMLLDRYADRLHTSFSRVQSRAILAIEKSNDKKIILAKPQTMMNLSGEAVAPLFRYYKLQASDLLVVYDDLDLPLGRLRLRPAGGSGGHKGIHSIISSVGRDDFTRLRVGIGRPPGKLDPADYVLQDFRPAEKELLGATLGKAIECVDGWLNQGLQAAMTECNRENEID